MEIILKLSKEESDQFVKALVSCVQIAGKDVLVTLPAMEVANHVAVDIGLTEKQKEVLEHIVGGRTNGEIARELGLSVKTVEKHRDSIYKLLDVHNVAACVHKANQLGLVGQPVAASTIVKEQNSEVLEALNASAPKQDREPFETEEELGAPVEFKETNAEKVASVSSQRPLVSTGAPKPNPVRPPYVPLLERDKKKDETSPVTGDLSNKHVQPGTTQAAAIGWTLQEPFSALDLSARLDGPPGRAFDWLAAWKQRGWIETVGHNAYRRSSKFPSKPDENR